MKSSIAPVLAAVLLLPSPLFADGSPKSEGVQEQNIDLKLEEQIQQRVTQLGESVRPLIAQLGDKRWKVREAATAKLKKIGASVLPFLYEMRDETTDPEIKVRLESILNPDIFERLITIQCDEAVFAGTTIESVVAYIAEQSRRHDPFHRGVPIFLGSEMQKAPVDSLHIPKLPLMETLQRLSDLFRAELVIEQDRVVITNKALYKLIRAP